MDMFDWLVKWFKSYCDGDWEHGEGIIIETLDNPGWSIRISLEGTFLEDKNFERIAINNGDDDWMFCKVENYFFEGYGDSDKLKEIVEVFKNWTEA